MRDLRLEEFEPLVGETFDLDAEGGPYQVELSAAQALPSGMREAGSFRLEWLGPVDPLLPQAIYTLRRGGDSYEIFLVAIGRDEAGTRYEAIFN